MAETALKSSYKSIFTAFFDTTTGFHTEGGGGASGIFQPQQEFPPSPPPRICKLAFFFGYSLAI